MASISTSNGLLDWSRKSTFAGPAIMSAFVLGHGALSPRFLKQRYGIDDNTNPRLDIATKGEEAVRKGKITRAQLDLLQRNQSLHENSIEHFPLFTSAILFSVLTGTPNINAFAATYLGLRAAYAWCYLAISDKRKSWARTVCWWAGNLACFTMLIRGARRVGSGRGL